MLDGSLTAPERPRIAIISHTHPSVTRGGAEIAAYSLYIGLRELEIDAIFIAACPSADFSRLNLASAREFAIAFEPDRYEHFYQLGEPSVARKLRALLVRERITVANFHHFMNFGANAIRAVADNLTDLIYLKTVMTVHEFLAICHHHGQMVTKPARRLCMAAAPQSCATCFPEHTPQQFEQRREKLLKAIGGLSCYVSPSHFLARRMATWGLQMDRIAIIENGVRDAQALRVDRQPHVPDTPFVFGYFGQLTPFKGVDILLDAADLIGRRHSVQDRIEIRIHGNLIGQSQAFTDRFNASVAEHGFLTYAGPYNNQDVSLLMSECDYVVMPSTWWENSPVVIQEAFMAGCPVICSGIGGMAEKVVEGLSGLHVKVGNGADLFRAIVQAADLELHSRLVEGLPRVKDHIEMARAYLDIFASPMADRNPLPFIPYK